MAWLPLSGIPNLWTTAAILYTKTLYVQDGPPYQLWVGARSLGSKSSYPFFLADLYPFYNLVEAQFVEGDIGIWWNPLLEAVLFFFFFRVTRPGSLYITRFIKGSLHRMHSFFTGFVFVFITRIHNYIYIYFYIEWIYPPTQDEVVVSEGNNPGGHW